MFLLLSTSTDTAAGTTDAEGEKKSMTGKFIAILSLSDVYFRDVLRVHNCALIMISA